MTISEFLADRGFSFAGRCVVPVGRLDKESSGVILLTDDEKSLASLLRPPSPFLKRYLVECNGFVNDAILDEIRGGIELSIRKWSRREIVKTLPCEVERVDRRVLKIGLREGKNRQIRKMLGRYGISVLSLHREAFGPFSCDDLKPGEIRPLTDEELKLLPNVY